MSNDTQRTRLGEFLSTALVGADGVPLRGQRAKMAVASLALHHEAGPLMGHVLLDLLEEQGFSTEDYDVIGGVAPRALPVATAVMWAAGSRGLDVDCFAVPPAQPDDGEGPDEECECGCACGSSEAEPADAAAAATEVSAAAAAEVSAAAAQPAPLAGPGVDGRSVVLVYDVTATGRVLLRALDAVRAHGGTVVAAASVVDYGTETKAVLDEAGVPFFCAFTMGELCGE